MIRYFLKIIFALIVIGFAIAILYATGWNLVFAKDLSSEIITIRLLNEYAFADNELIWDGGYIAFSINGLFYGIQQVNRFFTSGVIEYFGLSCGAIIGVWGFWNLLLSIFNLDEPSNT